MNEYLTGIFDCNAFLYIPFVRLCKHGQITLLTLSVHMRALGSRSVTRFTARHAGSIFIAIVILVFIRAGFFAGHNNPNSILYHVLKHSSNGPGWLSKPIIPSDNQRAVIQHPIPKLMEDAEAEFKKKLSSQSKTLKAAVAEYKRRYKRNPPKGFDEWFKFAHQNDVKMIDEYDGLMQDLEPFWALPGEEIRRRSRQV